MLGALSRFQKIAIEIETQTGSAEQERTLPFLFLNRKPTMSSQSPNQLITIREAARLLKVGDRQVRAWIKSGELTVINLGDSARSKHRISQAELQRFLASRTVTPQPAVVGHRQKAPAYSGRKYF